MKMMLSVARDKQGLHLSLNYLKHFLGIAQRLIMAVWKRCFPIYKIKEMLEHIRWKKAIVFDLLSLFFIGGLCVLHSLTITFFP